MLKNSFKTILAIGCFLVSSQVSNFAQTTLTIYDIQYTAAPSGDSPYKDQIVTTTGTVAEKGTGYYWLQDGAGAWNGLYIFDATNTPSVGDNVTLTGTVTEYYTLTELKTITAFSVNSSGNSVLVNNLTSLEAASEQYESVKAKLANAQCTNAAAGFNMWEVNDGTGPLKVDDDMYLYTPVLGTNYDITGMIHYSFSEWKILPARAADIVVSTTVSSQTNIISFSFPQQTGLATINSTNATVQITVASGTNLTNLVPTITVSSGATISPASGVARNFSSAITYLVTAEDNTTTKNWTVNVSEQVVTTGTPIYDIQYTANGDGNSPLNGTQISTGGVVTAVTADGYFIQDAPGAWHGIFVADVANIPSIGDLVSIDGTVNEFYNFTQIETVTSYVVNSNGNAVSTITVSTGTAGTEQYEGVLISISCATCTNPDAGYGMWEINDNSGVVLTDDVIIQYIPLLGKVYDFTGVVYYSYSQWKLLPRIPNDVTLCVTAVPDLQVDTISLVFYNLLLYPGATPERWNDIKTSMQYVKPDLFVVNELESNSGANTILNSALNTGGVSHFDKAAFVDGTDTDNMLFYNMDKFSLVSQNQISTSLRDISHYKLYYKSPDIATLTDTVFVNLFSCHLKASQGFEADRQGEIQSLINYLQSAGSLENVFIGGDFNFYSYQNEPGYVDLVINTAHAIVDPYGGGYWHNNISYAPIHTQSTRLTAFGGGSSGGVDDRFDFIFFSESLLSGQDDAIFLKNEYRPIGNDGSGNSFEQSINVVSNSMYPQSVLDALYNTSDHMPISMKFTVPNSGVVLSSEKEILSFSLAEQTSPATITSGTASVAIEVTSGSNLASLYPTVTVSSGATVSPASGVSGNFTNPLNYTVTAQNGTTKVWTVTVANATGINETSTILADCQVFPNPFDGTVRVRAPKVIERLVVTSIVGKEIAVFSKKDLNNEELDLQSLEKGVYFFTFCTENGNQYTKMVVRE